MANTENETSFNNEPVDTESFLHKGVVSVEYETLEGSAKVDKDFKYAGGKLVSEGQITATFIYSD